MIFRYGPTAPNDVPSKVGFSLGSAGSVAELIVIVVMPVGGAGVSESPPPQAAIAIQAAMAANDSRAVLFVASMFVSYGLLVHAVMARNDHREEIPAGRLDLLFRLNATGRYLPAADESRS
ncbi:MAG: hypothetical protein ACREXI_11545 [Caldimonas sp.]